ncbi:MAG: hypothetical protein ABII90_13015, partial [Bacteroidota bacterium]
IVSNDVPVVITVVNSNNVAIVGAQVRVERTSDGLIIVDEITDGLGVADDTINYPGSEIDVTIRVRKSSAIPKYFPISTPAKIKADGLSATISMVIDSIIG